MPARFVTSVPVTNRAGIVLLFLFFNLDISTCDILCVTCVCHLLLVCVTCVCARACARHIYI